jgi:hypothetical protein
MLRLLPVLLLVGLVAPVHAQFAIKGGVTFSTLSKDDLSPDFENSTGFAAGIHFGLGSGKFKIQPEALLIQVGASGITETGEGELNLSYLQIPVNLRFNFGSGGITPFILGGGYASFEMSCDVEDLVDDCDDLDLGGSDYGVDFGGGLKFAGGLFAEARYNLGLNESGEFNSKQRVFLILAGWEF